MLARFVPPGVREPNLDADRAPLRAPAIAAAVVIRGLAGACVLLLAGGLVVALVTATAATTASPAAAFDLVGAFSRVWSPASIGDWLQLLGIVACAIVGGLFVGARYGISASGSTAR